MSDRSLTSEANGSDKEDHGLPLVSETLRAYWEHRLAGGPNLSSVGYRGLSLAFNRWMYRIRAVTFDRALHGLPMDVARARVLDIGSGSGFYIDRWLRAGASEVVGLDLTEIAVATLRRDFPACEFLRLDIASSTGKLAANSFSAASAMDVLYHITDDASYLKALENISSVLQPGGFLILSENFLPSATLRSDYQVSRSTVEISESLRKAGLLVLKRVPMFVLMNTPIRSDSAALKLNWRVVRKLAKRQVLGSALGLALFPLERLLLRLVNEGPSTELVVCQKGNGG